MLLGGQQYYLHVCLVMVLYSIVAMGLRLIWRTGQVSFAQAGFMAIGAYTAALLTKFADVSFWIALPVAGIVAGLVALIIGIPTLKLRGSYFFLVTFAMGEVIRQFFNYVWTPVLGGPNGIEGIPVPSSVVIPGIHTFVFSGDYAGKTSYYFLALFCFFIAFLVMRRIDTSRVGKTIVALRDSEDLAEAVGIPTMSYRVLAFTVACFFTGVAGAIYGAYLSLISPISFTIIQSMEFLAFVIVGGGASIWGPILGTAVLEIIGEAVRVAGTSEIVGLEIVLSGFLMLCIMLFLRDGLLSVPRVTKRWINKRRGKIDDDEEARIGGTTA